MCDPLWVNFHLNEEGAVVTWQFTKTTSLEEVKPLLLSLTKMIKLPDNESLAVPVDNCCQVRRQNTRHI